MLNGKIPIVSTKKQERFSRKSIAGNAAGLALFSIIIILTMGNAGIAMVSVTLKSMSDRMVMFWIFGKKEKPEESIEEYTDRLLKENQEKIDRYHEERE